MLIVTCHVGRKDQWDAVAPLFTSHTNQTPYRTRVTGITTFLENGGAIEMAQYMGGHADPRTTKLYDRCRQQVTHSEVERIRYERKVQAPGGAQS